MDFVSALIPWVFVPPHRCLSRPVFRLPPLQVVDLGRDSSVPVPAGIRVATAAGSSPGPGFIRGKVLMFRSWPLILPEGGARR